VKTNKVPMEKLFVELLQIFIKFVRVFLCVWPWLPVCV
jgi:hypothetical protein